MDTIFARSTGAGRAAIAVWRISGPRAADVIEKLSGPVPSPRRASHRKIRTPEGGLLDDGIVLWFPGPDSATGEDLAELQLHGSIAVGAALADCLAAMGLRPAEPGEFTLRALRHGRIGLLEAEGLGDLLDAETEQQRQQALVGYTGSAREVVAGWREGLIGALAVLEAAVDFPDEEDIPAEIAARAIPSLERVQASLETELGKSGQGRRLREGLTLAIIGPPNAGKSTLLNRLVGEDRAIVSDIPGTTRDIVSARLDIAGRLVEVLDTAGLREETDDPIERAGMERSRAARAEADIVIELSGDGERDDPRVLSVTNKIDLDAVPADGSLGISALTGEGWDQFIAALTAKIEAAAAPALFTHDRQLALLRSGAAALTRVLENPALDPELLAEDVRRVIALLDQVTGKITVEDVLGAIFSRFCIGK